jgi:hypothetical protein
MAAEALIRVRLVALALAVVGLGAFGVRSQAQPLELKELMQEKFQIAEIFEAAAYASEKCPGLHVIEDGVNATTTDLGFTYDDADVIDSPAFKFWGSRGQMNARIGYEKNPTAWCESMWHFLGPDHPPMIKHTLLSKD